MFPHVLYVGVFLRDVTAFKAMFFKSHNQRGFAGPTGAYDPDQDLLIFIMRRVTHYRALND